jgi:hypothetical protein
MHFLANGTDVLTMVAGDVKFDVVALPLLATIPVSYDAADPPLPSEEDEDGTIVPTAALDDHIDAFGEDEAERNDDGEDEK